jgi:hypothetical protein
VSRRTPTLRALAALVALLAPAGAFAGGALETVNITGDRPSPIAGHLLADVIGIRWDSRCLPVRYQMNSTLDPVPVPPTLGAPFLTLAQAQATFERSFASWNQIPTSFIDLRMAATTVANPGLRGFDMKNELTFRTAANFTAIASSPSTSFIRDVTLVAGDDIDGDGDSDVSAAITTCQDADGDGDHEFPPGFYPAGTILDNDVQFNTKANGLRFTVDDAAIDNVVNSVDLEGVATHEFGHSFGLAHSYINQTSAGDGTGASMFPFIDTGDPPAELSQRSLHPDDIAWASNFYQEGSASSGPGALQHGDVRFRSRYGFIAGELDHGQLGQPVAGGHLAATDLLRGAVVSGGYSGTTRLSFNPANGGLFFLPTVADSILDGRYSIPVPFGLYSVAAQAVDGQPAAAGNISFTCQIGGFFGQQAFNDDLYGFHEADVERYPGFGKPILALPGTTRGGIDVVTNRTVNINNFGTQDFVGFTGAPAGRYYAVQIPAAQFTAATAGNPNAIVPSMLFATGIADASQSPRYAEATLTRGTVTGTTATIDLAKPLARRTGFLGRDNDFTPFHFVAPGLMGHKIRQGIADGTIENLFLVLRVPTTTPFPGFNGLPPLIGLDGGVATNDVPILGRSFISDDGGATFTQNATFNFRFSLVVSEPPTP